MSKKIWILSFFMTCLAMAPGVRAQFTVNVGQTNQTSPGPLWIHAPLVNNNSPLYPGNGIYIGKGLGGEFGRSMAVGVGALHNGAGASNTAIGYAALHNMLTLQNQSVNNVAVGTNAMLNNASGSSNTAIGADALLGATGSTGSNNVAIGLSAISSNTTGSNNVALGIYSLWKGTSGSGNTALGSQALKFTTSGSSNVAIGVNSMTGSVNFDMNAANNTAVGTATLGSLRSGMFNVAIGSNALSQFQFGNNNLAIGYLAALPGGNGVQGGNVSNEISIQNTIMGVNANGVVGSGNISIGRTPSVISGSSVTSLNNGTSFARLHLAGAANTPSLRLDNVPTVSALPVQNPGGSSGRYLFIDPAGIVCQAPLPAAGGGTINNCSTVGQVLRVNTDGSSLTCSQIFDNGTTSVGIGPGFNNSSDFTYTYPAPNWGPTGPVMPSSTGSHRLAVEGTISAVTMFNYSDERFKVNIKDIPHAMEKIVKLRGVTYSWNSEKFPDMGFSKIPQIGFIAQELEKVIPHAVVKNANGYYSVNYQTLIPVLTEGIKEQQTEIESLKAEIAELRNIVKQLVPGNVLVKEPMFNITPNPVKGTATISYQLEPGNTRAMFVVYDLQGKQIQSIAIPATAGKGQLNLETAQMGKGMYILGLISNGAEVQTKKFVVAE